MYLGASLTSAGSALVVPIIAYLAAGASSLELGAVMGGLAAAVFRPGPRAGLRGRRLAVRCNGTPQLWLADAAPGLDVGSC